MKVKVKVKVYCAVNRQYCAVARQNLESESYEWKWKWKCTVLLLGCTVLLVGITLLLLGKILKVKVYVYTCGLEYSCTETDFVKLVQ